MSDRTNIPLVAPSIMIGLGLTALIVSIIAFLVLGYSLFLAIAAGNIDDAGIHPLLLPFAVATYAISGVNIINAINFMARKTWRPFQHFLILSCVALALLTILWTTTASV